MLRHIVSWKLTAEDVPTKLEHSTSIAAELQSLVPLIPEIRSLSVASNVASVPGNWDLVLIADFDDESALVRYIEHPDHARVGAGIRLLVSDSAKVDILV